MKHRETETYAPTARGEYLPVGLILLGGSLAAASVFLPWTSNAGKMSAWGRWSDASLEGELADEVFNGLHASGGSWFGVAVLALGLFAVLAAAAGASRPGRAPRWLAPDGAMMASTAAFVVAASHFLARPLSAAGVAAGAPDPGQGAGVYLAMAGSSAAAAGSVLWMRAVVHTPLRPLPSQIGWGSLIERGTAVLILAVSLFAGWSFDEREEAVITPEIQAQIDELEQRARDNPEESAVLASMMLSLRAQAAQAGEVITDGITSRGPQLGLWALLAGLAALLTGLPAAGVFGGGELRRWRWSAATAGFGAGAAGTALAWIFTHVRSGHPKFVSGIGSFLAMVGGALILASTLGVLKEFRRAKVYGDSL